MDDVISAGTSVRESVEIITAAGATPAGVAIAIDRQERGLGDMSAVQEVQTTMQLPVCSIVNLDALISYLQTQPEMAHNLTSIQIYRQQYGV